jgi:diketogulonate reductase-like aldo/keto reductase
MLLRELANTCIRLPEIGFGTWNYSGGVEPLRAAIECGARLIDTAESYGTEEMVGQASRAGDIKCFSQLRCFLGISGGVT